MPKVSVTRILKNKIPVTADTQFAIGSATKAFTALSILMSQDEGKLSLDDSPKKYLSYFKMKDAGNGRKNHHPRFAFAFVGLEPHGFGDDYRKTHSRGIDSSRGRGETDGEACAKNFNIKT